LLLFSSTSLSEYILYDITIILKSLGIPIETIVLPWFLCFFLNYVPWRISLRVLDLMFSFGTNILFQVGLAVLSIAQKKLLNMKSIEGIYIDLIYYTLMRELN
jgi:hypothetical protein